MGKRAIRHPKLFLRGTTRLYFQLKEDKAGTVAAKDISSASLSAVLRFFVSPSSTTLALTVTGTKTLNPDGSDGAVTAGSTGWVYFDARPTGTAYSEVFAMVYLIDSATAEAGVTVSGYREYPWCDDYLVYEFAESPSV